MTSTPDAPAPASARAELQRVSFVTGDRCCIACGFNLIGQPVVREPVYAMFIVRCPECATCVAIQEYPTLGKWARRLSGLIASIWLGAILALLLASAGVVTGIHSASSFGATNRYAEEIAGEFLATEKGREYVRNQLGNNATQQQMSANAWTPIDRSWWEGFTEKRAVLDRAGGFGGAAARAGGAMLGAALTTAIAGVLLAGAVTHLRGARLLLPALVWLGFAGLFVWLSTRDPLNAYWGSWITASQIAAGEISRPLGVAFLGVGFASMAAALLAGRALLRWLATALLAPRLRVGLSELWLCDGKAPPRVAGAVSDRPPRRSA